MRRPTIKQLSYLITLAEEASFSRAANFCNVTQSTMSASIKELEDILGQTLVNRSERTVRLTAFGEDIVNHARKILGDIDVIVARANQMQEPLSGTLRLGVIPTIAPYFLPLILPEIQKLYPLLELQIHEDLTERLIHKLDQGRLDIILMAFPYNTDDLETHILFEENFVLASPESRKTPDALSIKDLKPDDLLLLDDGHCMRDQALSACNIKISDKRKTFSATSLPTLIQMVGHGYGVTLLPQMALKHLPDTIKLTNFKGLTPTRQIGVSWKKNTPRKQDSNEFHRILSQLSQKFQENKNF